MSYSSKILEDAVHTFSSLPSIGRKSALRMVLSLIKRDKQDITKFMDALAALRDDLKECSRCHNLSDDEICSICANSSRDQSLICIVESIRDVMAIEETDQYRGLYHVLGGVISPIEGVSAEDLNIADLIARITTNGIKEVILAISPTIDGDTTAFYLSRKLASLDLKMSVLSRGVAFGGELEYTDELTLGRSLLARIPYHQTMEG